MRPRLSGRGDSDLTPGTALVWKLQCGHGCRAVETVVSNAGPSVYRAGSMRPRLSARGDNDPHDPGYLYVALQCGHGFRAVETQGRSLTWKPPEKLQCGHGFRAVETS